jgi:hypothetical protein
LPHSVFAEMGYRGWVDIIPRNRRCKATVFVRRSSGCRKGMPARVEGNTFALLFTATPLYGADTVVCR